MPAQSGDDVRQVGEVVDAQHDPHGREVGCPLQHEQFVDVAAGLPDQGCDLRQGTRLIGRDHVDGRREPFKLSLLNSVDSMVRFIDDVHHPAVQANIDVSHLCLANVAPEELRRLKGKAIHVHISDCDGKVHGDLPPGRGVVQFEPYLREIAALGMDGAISIELEYSPQPDQIEAWVAEAYRETDRLMRSAGLRS